MRVDACGRGKPLSRRSQKVSPQGVSRRLEARIGELLPPEQGKRNDLLRRHDDEVALNREQLANFRQMAANREIVGYG